VEKLVIALAWEFLHDHFESLARKLEACGARYGSLFEAQLAVQIGDYLRSHCASTVYESWVRFMRPKREVNEVRAIADRRTLVDVPMGIIPSAAGTAEEAISGAVDIAMGFDEG